MSKKIVCSLLVMVFWLGNALAQNISMRVQLPFVDGERFECTQNSDDAPTHGRNDKYEVVDALATKFDLDFNLSGGTIVTAAADGKVSHGSDSDGFGNYIKIDHGNGYFSLYAHLMNNGYIAKEGNVVVAGQPIGFSGNSGKSTGPHLHFGVHKGSGVGTSVPMEVKAVEYGSDLKYITEKYFKTGYEEQREMYCQNELGLKNAGNIYEAVPSIGIFNQFQCNMLDNNQGVLCWQGDNGNFAFCEDGYHHVRYYPYNGGFRSENIKLTGENMLEMCYPANSKRVNLYAYLYDSTGVGGGGVIEEDLPNLQIRKVEVHDSNGNLLTEEKSYLQVGDQIEIRVWPVSREADAINGMEPGKDNIETDTFYKIALDESLENEGKILDKLFHYC